MHREVDPRKTELRRRIKAVLAALPPSQLQSRSRRVSAALFTTQIWQAAEWVFCFVSLPGEVDTMSILERAWAEGRQLGIPRIRGGEIVFHAYRPDAEPLAVNRYGIAEPAPGWPVLAPEDVPPGGLLVVCPGLAFDKQMNRLGRGGGYYDRFLGELRARREPGFKALGVCFSEQLVENVPVAPCDQRLDALVCEDRIIGPL